jgi:hypothetical protein
MYNCLLANSVNIKLQITTKKLWQEFKTPVSFMFRFKTVYNFPIQTVDCKLESLPHLHRMHRYVRCASYKTDMSRSSTSLATELLAYFGRQPFVVSRSTNVVLRKQLFLKDNSNSAD